MLMFADDCPTAEAWILHITERIWEGRGIDLIRRWYTEDVVIHLPGGDAAGIETVVAGTAATLAEFPDRRLLGEDVIARTDGPGDAYSSHRIVSPMHHRGDGAFGPATGRKVLVRTIADCLVRQGRICEEWLVRDQLAIVLQLGCDIGAFADAAARRLGPAAPAAGWDALRTPPAREGAAGVLQRIIGEAALALIAETHDPAVTLHLPGGQVAAGHEALEQFWLGYLGAFPDARLSVEHVIEQAAPARPVRIALRWRLAGTHSQPGRFGPPTGARVIVPGISHYELTGDRVSRAFHLVDELALLTTLSRHRL
jgi:predicted ester cyclase